MKERAERTWVDVVVSAMSGASLLIVLFLLAVGGFIVASVRAGFAKMFEEFDLALPRMTEAFLAVPSWVFLVAFAVLAVGLIGKEVFLRRLALVSLCLNVAVGWGLLIAGLVVYLSLNLPIWQLYTELN